MEGGITQERARRSVNAGEWVISGSAVWLKMLGMQRRRHADKMVGRPFQDGLVLALLVIGTKDSAK